MHVAKCQICHEPTTSYSSLTLVQSEPTITWLSLEFTLETKLHLHPVIVRNVCI